MTVLITGGTGRTGNALAKLLHVAGRPALVATRTGEAPSPLTAVKFDFFDETAYDTPFDAAVAANSTINGVYIISPPRKFDGIPFVKKFIYFAIAKGVKRIVLLSPTQVTPQDVPVGEVHRYIVETGIDYVVLRPTWFIQNFAASFLVTIRESDYIFSAAEDGRIPWISTDDIGQAAYDAFTAEKSENKDIFILGPELHTYDEAAKILSSVLGREIVHKRISVEELANIYVTFGLTPPYAAGLADMDKRIAGGEEEGYFHADDNEQKGKFIGKHTLLEYFKENRELWIKKL